MNREALLELLQLLDSLQALRLVWRYKEDRLAYLLERCRTFDGEAPPDERAARPFPDVPAVRWTVDTWNTFRHFDLPKSRRTRTTWTTSALIDSEAKFVRGSHIYVISEVDEKSEESVARCHYMHTFMDHEQAVPMGHLWETKTTKGRLEYVSFMGRPWGSFIEALPQREAAFRQYGATIVWIDEAGWQPRWRRLLQAVGPAARRLITTGTLGDNEPYKERCGLDELRAFEGPELLEEAHRIGETSWESR